MKVGAALLKTFGMYDCRNGEPISHPSHSVAAHRITPELGEAARVPRSCDISTEV